MKCGQRSTSATNGSDAIFDRKCSELLLVISFTQLLYSVNDIPKYSALK